MTGHEFRCRDAGVEGCDFEVKGVSSRDEVMQIASVHAKMTHKMDPIPADVAAKVSAAIKG